MTCCQNKYVHLHQEPAQTSVFPRLCKASHVPKHLKFVAFQQLALLFYFYLRFNNKGKILPHVRLVDGWGVGEEGGMHEGRSREKTMKMTTKFDRSKSFSAYYWIQFGSWSGEMGRNSQLLILKKTVQMGPILPMIPLLKTLIFQLQIRSEKKNAITD